MKAAEIEIIKASGEKEFFSPSKLRASLSKSGADKAVIEGILNTIQSELYPGMTTREIYNRAYKLLRLDQSVHASKYKLKKAIYELGPTGYPFEKFVGEILHFSGYNVKIGQVVDGFCVSHEIDVLADKDNTLVMIECKFHGDRTKKCNVKVPLYINSRFIDLKKSWQDSKSNKQLAQGWLVTNTRFTRKALQYGECANLYLLGWNYPKDNALKDRIDRLGLYPITVSHQLTKKEKQYLLSKDIVLCRQLLKEPRHLDHLRVSRKRIQRIADELQGLCSG